MTLRYTCLYVLLFTGLAFVHQYPVWLNLPPAATHQWRQADGAAIARHYSQDPTFGNARICNLFQHGDTHAVGELPLLYWVAGLVELRRDTPAYPLRWIGLLLLGAGGWAFGWMLLRLAGRPVIAALGAGLLLTTPVLAYYGPGFLPDAPAFCFLLVMAACLLQAHRRQSEVWLCAAAVAAALAVSLKISMAILPLALVSAWALEKWRRAIPAASLWNGPWPALAAAAAGIAVMGVRWWIAQYNADHHATYFLSGIRPIWWYDPDFILETIAMIAKQGLPAFASAGLYLACAGAVYLNSRHRPSAPAVLRNIFLFTVLGSAVYILLWFRMLREHDYYFICLLPIPVLLLLNGLRRAMHLYSEKRIVAALGLLFLLGVVHSHHILSKRLYLAFHPENHLTLPPDAFLPRYHLEYMGVHALARVLCPQDPSPNISLFALRRQGWTAYNFGDRINADTLRKYQTTLGMSHLALRDSTLYGPLYREFFPRKVCRIRGWYVYGE